MVWRSDSVREKVWSERSSEKEMEQDEKERAGESVPRRCVMWSSTLTSHKGFASHGTNKSLNYIAAVSGNLNSKSLVSIKRSGMWICNVFACVWRSECCVINLGVITTFVFLWGLFSSLIHLFIPTAFSLHHSDLCTVAALTAGHGC